MREKLKQLILPLAQIDAALPQSGTIYDIGCGEGVVANFLATTPSRQVIGLDLNTHKLESAQKHHLPNLQYKKVNVLTYDFPQPASGIIMADVLHHIPQKHQLPLLKKLAQSLRPKGVLVIKEINAADMIRSKLSRLWDFILYPQDKINYFSKPRLTQVLKNMGLSVHHQQTNLLAPASVHLYVARKA